MAVPILDLSFQHAPLVTQMTEAFQQILQSGRFILGDTVEAFEQDLAKACGGGFAVGVSSGTDALLAALMAMNIGPGDEIITSPFTFFATGGSIARMGAKPVFVDIDPVTMNLDPRNIPAAITPRTRAIMPVHLFGLMADMPAILKIASEHHLKVIEDAAQAIGASCHGQQAGTWGDVGWLSFYPTKNLSACGDAGACLINDPDLVEPLKSIRLHGQSKRYQHERIGGNFRIDALQAALLRIKLPHLPQWTDQRRHVAAEYHRLLADLPLTLPVEPTTGDYRHVYHQYTIRIQAAQRDALAAHLKQHEIGHSVFYPLPLHLQNCFAYLQQPKGSLPHAEQAADEVLSLPVFPGMTDSQVQEVTQVIRDFFN